MTPNSNSSDGDSKEAMETSAGGVSLSVGEKRKAETLNSEDSGESECESGGESEEEKIEDRFKWGYDSYDDREYHSSDQSEYSDKELEKQWRYYCRHVTETKGFFTSSYKFPRFRIGGFGSAKYLEATDGSDSTMRQLCTKLTSVCIKKYNEENKKNIKLEEILGVNYKIAWWSKYYITFSAKESEFSNAPLVEYQAKAVWCITRSDEIIYPILCRPSPTNNV